jgi:nitroreductase
VELHQAIRSRRTTHSFKGGAIPAGALERALEAAQWAPCHFQTWPWRFTRLGPAARMQFIDVAADVLFKEKTARQGEVIAEFKELVPTISELVFVSCVRDRRPRVNEENVAAVHAAIQNFLLSLTSEGVATRWETNPVMNAGAMYEFLNIDREAETIVAFILVGNAMQTEPAPERPPLSAVSRALP